MNQSKITMIHYDFIVVGGGPAGSACATVLARNDRKVLLLEKAKFPREKICGECINPRCWELFEMLGVNEGIRARHPKPILEVAIMNRTGTKIRMKVPFATHRPFIAMKRSVLDDVLMRNAESAGVEVREQTTVQNIEQTSEWKISAFDFSKNNEEIFSGRMLIGADGRNSIVAQSLNRKPAQTVTKEKRRIGLQWHIHAIPSIKNSVEMLLFTGGYCGIVNVNDECATVAMVTSSELAGLARHDFTTFLSRTIWTNPTARKKFGEMDPITDTLSAFPITPRWYDHNSPGAFLVGDAHRTVEPFTGEGIYFALKDGIETAQSIVSSTESSRFGEHFHSTFWVNKVFSSILRRPPIADFLVTLGSRAGITLPIILRTVFPN